MELRYLCCLSLTDNWATFPTLLLTSASKVFKDRPLAHFSLTFWGRPAAAAKYILMKLSENVYYFSLHFWMALPNWTPLARTLGIEYQISISDVVFCYVLGWFLACGDVIIQCCGECNSLFIFPPRRQWCCMNPYCPFFNILRLKTCLFRFVFSLQVL